MKKLIRDLLKTTAKDQFKRTQPFATGGLVKPDMNTPLVGARPIPALMNELSLNERPASPAIPPKHDGSEMTVTVNNTPGSEPSSLSQIEAMMVEATRARRMVDADLMKLAGTFKGMDIVCDPNLRGMAMKLHVSPIAYEQIKKEAEENGTE